MGTMKRSVPFADEVARWVSDACTNGKTTTEIAKHYGISVRVAYGLATEAEGAGLLVGALIRLRDGAMVTRDEAKIAGVGPILWQEPEDRPAWPSPPTTLKDIAARIDAHLKRFEANRKKGGANESHDGKIGGLRPYFNAWAGVRGRYVAICYVAYRGASSLTKDAALAYLTWLDAGNVGGHFKQQREATDDAPKAKRPAPRAPKAVVRKPTTTPPGASGLEDPDKMARRLVRENAAGEALGAMRLLAKAIRERDAQHRRRK